MFVLLSLAGIDWPARLSESKGMSQQPDSFLEFQSNIEVRRQVAREEASGMEKRRRLRAVFSALMRPAGCGTPETNLPDFWTATAWTERFLASAIALRAEGIDSDSPLLNAPDSITSAHRAAIAAWRLALNGNRDALQRSMEQVKADRQSDCEFQFALLDVNNWLSGCTESGDCFYFSVPRPALTTRQTLLTEVRYQREYLQREMRHRPDARRWGRDTDGAIAFLRGEVEGLLPELRPLWNAMHAVGINEVPPFPVDSEETAKEEPYRTLRILEEIEALCMQPQATRTQHVGPANDFHRQLAADRKALNCRLTGQAAVELREQKRTRITELFSALRNFVVTASADTATLRTYAEHLGEILANLRDGLQADGYNWLQRFVPATDVERIVMGLLSESDASGSFDQVVRIIAADGKLLAELLTFVRGLHERFWRDHRDEFGPTPGEQRKAIEQWEAEQDPVTGESDLGAPTPASGNTTAEKCRQYLLQWWGIQSHLPKILNPDLFRRVEDVLKSESDATDEATFLALFEETQRGPERGLSNFEAEQPDKLTTCMTWQEAAQRMERLRTQGEAFTSQHKLANDLGCSSGTINKAIKATVSLQAWAKVQTAAPRAQSINNVVTDRTAQRSEVDPQDDAAIREFIELADPKTKAWFLALPIESQIIVVNDPDKHRQILGRKP